MEELKQAIEKLSSEELERANKKFGMFSSPHEGYAVAMEEWNEVADELEHINNIMSELWKMVKLNENADTVVRKLKLHSNLLACESIQLSAMAQKYIDSNKKRED